MTFSLDYALSLRSVEFQFSECARACCENQLSDFLQGVLFLGSGLLITPCQALVLFLLSDSARHVKNHPALHPQVTIFLHFLWVGPLQAAAVVGLLWMEIGPSCLVGMVVLMFLMPVQTLFGRLFSKFR